MDDGATDSGRREGDDDARASVGVRASVGARTQRQVLMEGCKGECWWKGAKARVDGKMQKNAFTLGFAEKGKKRSRSVLVPCKFLHGSTASNRKITGMNTMERWHDEMSKWAV